MDSPAETLRRLRELEAENIELRRALQRAREVADAMSRRAAFLEHERHTGFRLATWRTTRTTGD